MISYIVLKLRIYCLWIALLFVSIQAVTAQDKLGYAVSVQGGPNIFFGNAYPSNIVSTSFAGTFDWKGFSWGGLLLKAEHGSLTGSAVYADGTRLFDSNVNYNMLCVSSYLDVTNILFGTDKDALINILVFGGFSMMNANYSFPYINTSMQHRYTFGTDKNPETVFPLLGGGILEIRLTNKLKGIIEFTGVLEYTDRIDGIAYGAVDKEKLEYYDPKLYRFLSYKKENEITHEHPDPIPLGFFDNFATLEFGLKYSFGGSTSKGKKAAFPSIAAAKKGKSNSSKNRFLIDNGFSFYGGAGLNKWWSNANIANTISYNASVGADKNINRWLLLGLDLQTGKLSGDRIIAGSDVFTSRTSFSKTSLYSYFDVVNFLSSSERSPRFHLKFFGGASLLLGSINVEQNTSSLWRSYYDLENTPNTYSNVVVSGGAMWEYEVSDRVNFFMKATGVVEPTDNLDGVGYLHDQPTPDGGYKYYDFTIHDWKTVTEKPSKEDLAIGWYDNFATFEIGFRYNISKFESGKVLGRKKKAGSKTNTGIYKMLPTQIYNFRGPDGMEKDTGPKY